MKHSLLLYVRHHLCPRLCVSLHLLCISLLPCRKKHNSFVVYSSQSGSELGVVSCFLCSPDSADSGPVALFSSRNSCFFFRKLQRVITVTIIKSSPSLFYKYVADFQVWVISQPQSHAKGQDFDENNVMQGLHRHYREKKLSGDQTDRLTWSMTAAR